MKIKICLITCLFFVGGNTSYAQLNISKAYITISKGTSLVVKGDKINADAGGIISEDSSAKVVWYIGNNTNQLNVPFVNVLLQPIPVSFKLRSGASDEGHISFATYAGANWKNSSYLPPMVTNVNHNGIDNSSKLVDRFWLFDPVGYITPPDILTLNLPYTANEITAAGNSISESALIGQRWNEQLNTWDDYFPATITHGGQHYITISNISHTKKLGWWAATDGAFALPLTLVSFKAENKPQNVFISWQTTEEININHFEIERSMDGTAFVAIAKIPAATVSAQTHSYSYTDLIPFPGVSYYRLKWIDNNGAQHYSQTAVINRDSKEKFAVFPNPATDVINVSVPQTLLAQKPLLQLYDAGGRLVLTSYAMAAVSRLAVQHLAGGNYLLRIVAGNNVETFTIIKQ